MTVLRVYLPAECDSATGVPLDWERCRACKGTGRWASSGVYGRTYVDTYVDFVRDHAAAIGVVPPSHEVAGEHARTCAACDGFGSLRAVALDVMCNRQVVAGPPDEPLRCEDCCHPMSEGTWEGVWGDEPSTAIPVEASWRPVDVRWLSWPMDLSPEQLALLCLRCWAERTAREHPNP